MKCFGAICPAYAWIAEFCFVNYSLVDFFAFNFRFFISLFCGEICACKLTGPFVCRNVDVRVKCIWRTARAVEEILSRLRFQCFGAARDNTFLSGFSTHRSVVLLLRAFLMYYRLRIIIFAFNTRFFKSLFARFYYYYI